MFSRTVTMTLTEFLNQPKQTTIQEDLSQFHNYMNDVNKILEDIQQTNNWNNQILNNDIQVMPQNPVPGVDQVVPTKLDIFKNIVPNNLIPEKGPSLIEYIKEIAEPLKTIAKFLDYLMHPGKILFFILNWTIEWSYYICLIAALISFILYMLGDKKKFKYIPISIVVYALLQAIGVIIK